MQNREPDTQGHAPSGVTTRRFAGLSHVGRKRDGNEDAFLMDDDGGLFVVADGMGGRSAGEVASRLVVDSLHRTLEGLAATDSVKSVMTPLPEFSEAANRLVYGVLVANKRTHEYALSHPECKGMGSTVSAVLVVGDRAAVCNVGDSPVYRIRDGGAETLSTPHTVMAEQEAFAAGGGQKIDKQYLHMITRAMGVAQSVQPDLMEVSLRPGDAIVICSDGLSDKAFPEEIAEIVTGRSPEEACESLVAMANDRGGDDNITVIVVAFDRAAGAAAGPGPEASAEDPPHLESGCGRALVVEYDTEDASYTSVCKNLRGDGLFLETREAFRAGESLLLHISDPETEEGVMVSGVVAGRRPQGVEITFEDLTADQIASIQALVRPR